MMYKQRVLLIIAILLFLLLSILFPIRSSATTISCYERVPMGRFKLTAYCPCCDCSDDYNWETSTGKTAKEGRTIATDPKIIEPGSQVLIGDTVYIAEDCGGKVKGDVIDIFFENHEDVDEFEVKYCDVYIIRGEWEQ